MGVIVFVIVEIEKFIMRKLDKIERVQKVKKSDNRYIEVESK
jgi:hypothetical protein